MTMWFSNFIKNDFIKLSLSYLSFHIVNIDEKVSVLKRCTQSSILTYNKVGTHVHVHTQCEPLPRPHTFTFTKENHFSPKTQYKEF